MDRKEARRIENARWRAKNLERKRASDRAFAKKNPHVYAKSGAKYRAAHKERERERKRLYRQKYPERINALTAFHRATRRQATPSWANEFFISEAYDLARRRTIATGYKWHVDHIVPLVSPIVCGLHVEHNLQVIPARDNQRKNNRHWPDMPMPSVTSAGHSFEARGSQ